LSENPPSFTEQPTKQSKSPYFQRADDELMIIHDSIPRPHRLVFKNREGTGTFTIHSSIFNKIISHAQKYDEVSHRHYFKNEHISLSLSTNGKIKIWLLDDISEAPKHFIKTLENDLGFSFHEIHFFINHLDFCELEIAHKIEDPQSNLKKSKIKFDIEGLVNKLIAFTDESFGNVELEIKGDPETSGNLEFLLRDKLNAVLYFAELTKIITKLMKIQEKLNESLLFIKNGLTFLIDDLLNKRLVFTERGGKDE